LAVDGRGAIGLATGSGFYLIITDINMPEMDGLDLARQLRNSAEYSSTPIIFLTTEATEDYMAKGKEIGTSTLDNQTVQSC
jgi:CheY-like chemotaxis protein